MKIFSPLYFSDRSSSALILGRSILLVFLTTALQSVHGQELVHRHTAAVSQPGFELLAQQDAGKKRNGQGRRSPRGIQTTFPVDRGWKLDRFPEHAACYETPERIAEIYRSAIRGKGPSITSYPKPADRSLRVIATGHSFMIPGFKTFPLIAKAAGLQQPPLLTHTGGGMTGSARYKWEQENGIFQFDHRPVPKLLASIANAKWDAMMWGPYYNDRPEYYVCWMDFCLKYNPEMKFYLSDAWPQIDQLGFMPKSEKQLDFETIRKLGEKKNEVHAELVDALNKKHTGKVFVLPTSDAMLLAAKYYHQGKLPGVEGIHTLVGRKKKSLWRDRIGHLGPGFENLEGYVFYATLYGKSPELIDGKIAFGGPADYPGPELDRMFRKIAWEAVINHPLSGVVDRDKDGERDK